MTTHIPLLRFGEVYESLDTADVVNHRDGAILGNVSQANAGLIRRDLRRAAAAAACLRARPAAELWNLCEKAGELFLNGTLALGGDATQTPQQYVEAISSTSGLPQTLCRQNMAKIHHVMTNIRRIVRGLSRGIDDLNVFDRGAGDHHGVPLSFIANTDVLGVVLPSNSPGVNSIWLPAVALKTPVMVKPGREEPWTPWRIIAALTEAGFEPAAFGFYPTDHEGADAILNGCGRSVIFGDDATLQHYAANPSVQVHGTGHSKVVFGEDLIDRWPQSLDVLVDSVLTNGGRSCINASSIVVPRHADAVANSLARRLAAIEPRSHDSDQAVLCAFANAKVAESIDAAIDRDLKADGARDVTAAYRDGPRLRRLHGATYVLPTVVRCHSLSHRLGNTEFLFPYTSVVELSQEKMLDQIGPSLVVSAVTKDEQFIQQLLRSPLIDRLNVGPVSTCAVQWDQPHEGNLFDFLYRRRAIQWSVASD